jgi:hypothetical protein
MSLDYAAGSRAGLFDFVTQQGWRTGGSSMAVIPNLQPDMSVPAGAFTMPGNGHVNRPPQAVISYLNAASFRVNVGISGNGLSASFNKTIDLGKTEQYLNEDFFESGTLIESLDDRWAFAIRPLVGSEYAVPSDETFLEVFEEDESGRQESLDFFPKFGRVFPSGLGNTQVRYYYNLDLWQIRMNLFIGVNDGDFGGDQATALHAPLNNDGPFSSSINAFGMPFPMLLGEGSSVSGEITVESWLPVY